MIVDSGGKSNSIRTSDEIAKLLKGDLSSLSDVERETLKILIKELKEDKSKEKSLLDMIGEAEFKRTPVDIKTFCLDRYYLGNTCDNIYPKLLDDLTELFSGGYCEAIFSGSLGWGKCISILASYLTRADTGERLALKDLVGSSPLVPSLLENNTVGAAVAQAIWFSGIKPCIRMTLASGQWLEASFDHPVLTPLGWRRVDELQVSELVATARTAPEPTCPLNVSDDVVIGLGLLIADGSLNGHSCFYIKGNPALVNLFEGCICNVPGFDGFGKKRFERGAWYVSCCGVMPWIRSWGLDELSKHKRIPGKLFGLPRRQLALLIRAIWTDGNVYLGKPYKLELCLASEGLIDDVQEALRRFGVIARKSKRVKTIKKKDGTKKQYDAWRLQIADAENIKLFLDEVGFVFGLEKECRELREKMDGVESNTNWDIVPITTEQLKIIRSDVGPVPNKEWKEYGSIGEGSYMGRQRFQRLVEHFGYKGQYAKYALMDVVWEKVQVLEDIGDQPVADLTVPGPANAVVNGIISHNTFLASIGICRILYELSCMANPHQSFGLAKDSNISVLNLSVNEGLAIKVVFENIASKIKSSPYFQEYFKFDVTKKELRFPHNVWVAARASTDTSALGLNVIAGILDECVEGSTKILLGDGSEATAFELMGMSSFHVQTFDFVHQCPVSSVAFIKESTVKECFSIILDNGTSLTASDDHPLAVRTSCGTLAFKSICDICVGEDVVIYGKEMREFIRGTEEAIVGDGQKAGCEESDRRVKNECRSKILRGARLGLRGMGRELSVAKVVSTRRVGRRQTYSISVPRYEVFIADNVLVHNTNFMPKTKMSRQQLLAQTRFGSYDRAETLYAAIQRRMKSRFAKHGKLPGMLFVVSSKRTKDDFTARRIRDAKNDPDVFVRDYCLTGDTRIPLVDGTIRTLAELVDLYDEENFWVYSFDLKKKQIVPAVAHHPRLTYKQEPVLRLTFDNGESVRCTPWHPFLMRDGRYARAEQLKISDRLMPFCFNSRTNEVTQPMSQGLYQFFRFARFEKLRSFFGLDRHVIEMKEDGLADVYDLSVDRFRNFCLEAGVVAHNSLWDVRPEEYYSDKKFFVLCGNESIPSRIIPDEEVEMVSTDLPEGVVLIEVPDDFRSDFTRDLEGSIRDIAGIATVAIAPFIQRREKLEEAIDTGRQHPFSDLVYDPGQGGKFKWGQMLMQVSEEGLGGAELRIQRPKINPYAVRHAHIDPSLRGDATGFCMAHIGGWKEVERRTEEGSVFFENAPIYIVDVILRIVPPLGDEIILGDIRRLIYDLVSHGYSVGMVTLDSFQSADSLQQLKARGYNAELLSVDRSIEPYAILKEALYENRLFFYNYPPLLHELRQIEFDRERNKVDHPMNGSKDVADALAGCLYTLSQHRVSKPIPLMKGRPYSGDAWLEEQRQAIYAGDMQASVSTPLEDLPPFIVGYDDTF